MSITYTWPGWGIDRFEMWVAPNVRVYPSAFTASAQTVDLGGERFQVSVSIPLGNGDVRGGEIEAFFDRMYGPINRISMWNLKRPVPLGTLRDGAVASVINASLAAVSVVNGSAAAVVVIYGTPVLTSAIALQGNTASISTVPGRSVLAGDMLGINGQLVRSVAASTADGSGNMVVEFTPRMRASAPAYTQIVWNKPTANFMLKSDGVPLAWRPGMYDSASFDLIEAP